MFVVPWWQNCYPEDYKFHNFGRGPLTLHHHAFNFSCTCLAVQKIFENWSILSIFCPACKAPGAQGPWNSQFLFPFTHRCYKPNLVEIGSTVPEEAKNVQKCTNDVRRRTKTDRNRSPESLRWPKNLIPIERFCHKRDTHQMQKPYYLHSNYMANVTIFEKWVKDQFLGTNGKVLSLEMK
jgi:hypothetical protein